MIRSHRSRSWLLAASAAAIVALVLLGRALVAPEPPAAPENTAGEQVEGGTAAPASPSPAAGAARSPDLTIPAVGVESSPEDGGVPPPLGSVGDGGDENPPIEPEQAQTPEWRLEKTTRLVTLVRERIGRLEARAAAAARRGDGAAAGEARILLDRSRRRLEALEQDVQVLRRELGEGEAVEAEGPR